MTSYDVTAIEKRWQDRWAERRAHEAAVQPGRPKYYCLEMLPYPSGRIHMGHVRNYAIGDVMARFQRMRGRNVLHPIGWDSFGLPAENAAIAHGVQPLDWTEENIARMRAQFRRLGFSYAWEREIAAHRPEYYRWNQWLFLRMLERDLIYRARRAVNWCDTCRTVLANEQAEGGTCWRCGNAVRMRSLPQWFARITRYGEELAAALEALPGWPEKVLTIQRNWIGRSVGAEVRFAVLEPRLEIPIFTTRIDTIFGCTFLVLAPEHPRLAELIEGSRAAAEVRTFCEEHRQRTTAERELSIAEKVGCFTGRHAVNPFSGEAVPIWVANFAVADYGTGALMAVPAHDERDHEFARTYGLPIRQVIEPLEGSCDVETAAFTADGILMGSGPFTGLGSAAGRERMTRHADATGFGAERTLFRLKDWGISRQRYWGTPIPIIHCDGCGAVPVPDHELPVRLPEGIPITGKGGSPLESVTAFVEVPCPRCGTPARRDTDTMDTFIDSSWYYFRYCDPHNTELPFGPEANHWFPVDLYVGGVEHAALHLIYTRFFTKVLADLGLIAVREPVTRHLSQGMVVDWSYRCPEHGYLAAEKRAGDWKVHPDQARCGFCDGLLEVKKEKMSKSKYNTVDPDYLLDRYGADTTRLFALFAAPPEKDMDWSDAGIEGCDRFLARVRRLADRLAAVRPAAATGQPPGPAAVELRRKIHDTIRRVTLDIEERLHLNTPVAAIMELVNLLQATSTTLATEAGGTPATGLEAAVHEGLGALALLLSPFAPHLASEMWERLGRDGDAAAQPWPGWDETLLARAQATVVIQVNGKLRARVEIPAGSTESEVVAAARREANVAAHLEGKRVVKTIHIPDKLLNLVVA